MKNDVYISVDIEADGPIPGDYSMSSFGAVVVEPGLSRTFYAELRPITDNFNPQAAAVSGLDRQKLITDGLEPRRAMYSFSSWIGAVCANVGRPVFVGFNATFDWMWITWYFHHFVGSNPFGISGIDIKAYYLGLLRKNSWGDTAKRNFEKRFLSKSPHTHNALDDAKEQADMFMKLRDYALNNK